MSVLDLPPGLNVYECDVEGVVVTYEGTGSEFPEPGTAVVVTADGADGGRGFTLEVAPDGTVSYRLIDG
ncbi:hypothetical protein AB0M28_21455 [Streptomyces sp. NPDC051940]|uniref:hypothetical protein n=1 Tax=Streptomyces sp. NPDC051940 TaxID=3155675 RepID=UPI003424915A